MLMTCHTVKKEALESCKALKKKKKIIFWLDIIITSKNIQLTIKI